MKSAKPARIRFYFDADILGLAKLVCRERSDCTYPSDPGGRIQKRMREPCPITEINTDDLVWLPQIAAREWVIITRDRGIREHRAEIAAVRDNNAKMVNLYGPDAIGTWAQLEVLMCRWHEIERLVDMSGPFIYLASRTGRLRPLDLT